MNCQGLWKVLVAFCIARKSGLSGILAAGRLDVQAITAWIDSLPRSSDTEKAKAKALVAAVAAFETSLDERGVEATTKLLMAEDVVSAFATSVMPLAAQTLKPTTGWAEEYLRSTKTGAKWEQQNVTAPLAKALAVKWESIFDSDPQAAAFCVCLAERLAQDHLFAEPADAAGMMDMFQSWKDKN